MKNSLSFINYLKFVFAAPTIKSIVDNNRFKFSLLVDKVIMDAVIEIPNK